MEGFFELCVREVNEIMAREVVFNGRDGPGGGFGWGGGSG